MTKRILAVALCGLLCLGMAGCGAEKKGDVKSIKIGMTVYDQYDVFLSEYTESFNEYASVLMQETGVTINIESYNAATSQSTQNSQVESMIRDGCDVICVNLVDRTDTATIIDLAQQSGIPIVFYNRQLVAEDLERWDRLYYVGADASQSGIMQGELAADYIMAHPEADKNGDGLIQYIMLEGEGGHQDAILRTELSTKAIEQAGISLDKAGASIANWRTDLAKSKVTGFLEQGVEAELILCNNDAMALGAIDAYRASGKDQRQWPAIFGIDGVAEGLSAIEDGSLVATVYNDGDGQAKAMLDLAFALATGRDLSGLGLEDGKYITLPYKKITKENVGEYR